MNTTDSNSQKTVTRIPDTNAKTPKYDTRPPAPVPAASAPPRGTPIARDTRKNSGGN